MNTAENLSEKIARVLNIVGEYATAYIGCTAYSDEGQELMSYPDILESGNAFWQVGRNASHEFYLGVDADGNMIKRSWTWCDECEEQSCEHTTHVSKVEFENGEHRIGYVGHY